MSLTPESIRECIPHAKTNTWGDSSTTEQTFLESMAQRLDKKYKLSEKQEALCQRIMQSAAKVATGVEAPAMTPAQIDQKYGEAGFKPIHTLFEQALQHLKRPQVTLENDLGDLVIIKVAGGRSRYVGQVQVITEDNLSKEEENRLRYHSQDWKKFLAAKNNRYHGRINDDGLLVKARTYEAEQVESLLVALATDPETTIRAYGAKTGRCACCGKKLKTVESTTHGYGPTCAKNYGLKWGKKSARELNGEREAELRTAVQDGVFATHGKDHRWGVYENGDLLMVFDNRPKAAKWITGVEGDFKLLPITKDGADEATTAESEAPEVEEDGWF